MIGGVKRIGLAAIISLSVAALGSLTWGPLLVANTALSPQLPWSVPAEAIVLLLIWLYGVPGVSAVKPTDMAERPQFP